MSVVHLLRHPVDTARRWPVESQLRARRNAMVASTALAQRRAELVEVEEYLAASAAAQVSAQVSAQASVRAAHG